MNINEFRKTYPQYNDLSDAEVASKLHSTFYSDMDKKAFNEKLFEGTGSFGKDIAQSVKVGGAGLLSLPSNVYGLVTGDYEKLGGPELRKYQETQAAKRSPLYQYREREAQTAIEEAQKRGELSGAGEAVKQYLTDPRLLTGTLAETAPSMLGGMGAGKVAQAGITAAAKRGLVNVAEKGAARAGFGAATGTMAAQQGGDVAQNTYEKVYQAALDSGRFTDAQARELAISEARKAGLQAAGVSALTMTALPGFEKAAFTGLGAKSAMAGATKGFLGEATQEALEEGGGQLAQNLAMRGVNPEQALTEGMGAAMAKAGIMGGLMGAPAGGLSGSAEGNRLRQIELVKQEALRREAQQREQLQAATEAQNLAQTQPQLPGMETPLVGPAGVRLEEAATEAPAFELAPQNLQGELDVTTPQPAAPEAAAPAVIDNTFLKSAGLASAVGLKAKGKNSIVGLDLNDPQQAAEARQKLLKVGETTKSGTIATAIEETLKSDPRLQEQPELGGFPNQQELQSLQVQKDMADAEAARIQRNKQLEAMRLGLPEVQSAPKEEVAPAGVEAGQPSAGVPSEVGVQDQPVGPEPSVDVYDAADRGSAAEDRDIGGGALGPVGPVAQERVEDAGAVGNTLNDADTNRILAGLRKEGLTKEEARQQVAESTPEELADLAKLYAPIQTAAKTTAEQEAEIADAAQAEGEFGDISARQVAAPAPAVGMSKEQTQGIVDRLKQGWKRGVNVVVKNFADETPGRQAAMKARGLDTAKGYIDHDGTVVVLAENNKDEADIAATLFHETLGHLGLRLKFREELTNMMEKFYHTNADLKRAANKWLLDHKGEYDEQMPVNEKYAKAVEEVLAERAEAGRLPAGIMDKIKAFINKWARKAGLNVDFSDAEIRSILDQAQQEITEKTGEAKTEPAKELAPRAATRAAAILEQMGRTVKQVEESKPFQEKFDAVKEAAKAPAKWRDLVETMVFSADARINNEIRRALLDKLEQGGQEAADAMAKLYSISTSQALHNEAVAHQFIEQGNVEYDPELYKFVAKEDKNSWAGMIQELKKIADQHGFTFPEMEAYAQAALEARRLKGINEFNAKIEAEAVALEAKGKKDRAEKKRKELKLSHMTDEQIKAGNELFKEIPGLEKITEMWNGIRANAMKVAVDSGLYSQERAEDLLEAMDYVPFYRVEQLESKAGPKEFSRGLLDAAREYRFKGSEQEVNNIFDNMERWTSYMIRRAVNNKTAQNLVQVSQDVLQEAKEVPKAQRGMEANTVAIWQNGERKFYEFSDPLFVKAFTGLEPVALPAFKALSKFSNALRKNIVLNPLFSVSQLSQDSFAAMLTSGLKHPFRLPLEVMKEFVKTLRGTSEAHQALKAVGAAGVRDYSATISRLDAEQAAGLKAPSTWEKLLSPLEKFSMASDNAVRQAIYNMTMQETGGDKAKAIERAFEIINFRRKGASGTLAIAGQVIPFFNAYLQAQNVAYKVLTGRGVSPTARKEARNILAANTVKIMALATLYAAVMADDDDYKKLDPTIRDRHWIIPGTGLMLPTRTDLFSMPKIIAEHTYNLMTDQGFEDGTKAKRAMKDAFVNAITGPTPVPQAFKPLVEVALNRNFYTGRPIVGRGIENLQTSEQFTASTSGFAKAIGSTGIIAPVNVDHLIRGYLGTTGGLTLMAMDAAINSASGVPAPSKSMQDTLASTPGLSTFVTKEFGGSAKTDFYELKGMVDEVSATMNRLQKTGRGEEAKALLAEEGTKELLKVKTQVSQIQSQLSKLRERENLIRAMPETRMDADQKETEIRKIRETEQRMLANVSKLRRIAGL